MFKQRTLQSALKSLLINRRVYGVKMNGHAGMTKREQELRQKVSDLKDEAADLVAEGKQEEAKAKIDEAKATKAELDNFLAMMETFNSLELPGIENRGGQMPVAPTEPEEEPKNYNDVFFKALRGKRLSHEEMEVLDSYEVDGMKNAMRGDEDESGGLIIPKDIQTRINEFKRQFDSLEKYVTVEPVSTRSGSRVLEKNADMAPLENITNEMDPINDMEGPKFENMSYNISDYAGILKISNTLLADTDQNLMNYLAKWIAKKSIVTRNFLILQVINALAKKTLTGLDDIKDVLNVELDPAISQNAIVLTNQDGFNYLDKLKNEDGTYILEKDPKNATRKLLQGKPVVVISNRFFKSTSGTAPMVIGDLKEAVVLFDRQKYSLKSTDVGDDAFRKNTTNMRVIEREDVRKWDSDAAVFGEITIETVPEG